MSATTLPPELDPPRRLLMGPGPSTVPPRVLTALARPTVGHLDPYYLRLMDETSAMLRTLFGTENRLTLAISGTGSAAMEAGVANVIEPGDAVLVGIAGVFGGRIAEMARRHGAEVHTVEVPWGETITPEAIADALAAHPQIRAVAIVHAETSTGAHQPLEAIARRVRDHGALFLVDAVTSLGGLPLEVDAWGIDVCWSGTQKCLSCPPGVAPITFSDAALEIIEARRTPARSWYLDMALIARYWGGERAYHHTAPINMSYALYEALRIALAEGLEARIARHRRHHEALRAGLEALGLRYIPSRPLATLNAVAVPEGVDDARVRRHLLDRHDIEIGGGLGPFAGRAWRIGLMGESARRKNVTRLLAALESVLAAEGAALDRGAAVAAADAVWDT